MRASSRGRVRALACAVLLLLAASAARALDFLDQRIQIHGYFEEQIRTISDDLNSHLDLTQWYHVLNIEMDLEIAPEGFGPFDSVGAYMGLEVRYDCVWTRACALSGSTNVFGNRSRVLPERLSQAQSLGFSGTTRVTQPVYRQPQGKIDGFQQYPANPNTGSAVVPTLPPLTVPFRGFNQLPAIDTLLGVRQVVADVPYVPALYTFQRFLGYGFAFRSVRGTEDLGGTQTMPWDPKDDVDPQSTLANIVNPFRVEDVNPITGQTGGNALPYRPAPLFGPLGGPADRAQGLFYPSPQYARYLRDGGSDPFQQNFSQSELSWNYGASQQQTKVLKEAYVDLNMLDGRLFTRLGRQTIVWGKTELFATTDQFNPNDLALASLPKLEESRIPIWAARSIYSFYEVGPFEDVRLEVAADLDDFYPDDLGRCGEAYTPNPVCDKTYGLMAHGIAGLGVAGEDRPPHWWQSTQGLQGGARLEFRWESLSFALVDFYNYEKIPYAKRLTTYSRNVDPTSGMPRRMNATGPCQVGNEPSCLQGGADALENSALNQQYFAFVCSSSVGFNNLDRNVCAQSVLNSQAFPVNPGGPTVTELLSQLFAGSPNGIATVANSGFLGPGSRIPIVSLSIDANDGAPFGSGNFVNPGVAGGGSFGTGGFPTNHNNRQTLAQTLNPSQQALLGCGSFYGTSCDGAVAATAFAPGATTEQVPGGIDLLNAEASALLQSWIGFDGTPQSGMVATDGSRPQPGTVGFQGGPVCSRVAPNGQVVTLPGCRPVYLPDGSRNPEYDPSVDGPDTRAVGIGVPFGRAPFTPARLAAVWGPATAVQGQPFTGQTWQSEMAALSWNVQMVLVAFSDRRGDPGVKDQLGFDPNNAFRTDGCSYVLPQYCSAVQAFWAITGVNRNTRNAAGNGRFGRRDFVWAGGGEVVLSYQRRNVLGLSTDFAEDYTKSNWGIEFTWVNRQTFQDANQFDGISKPGTLNLTVSVDRPTFINFLNQSRTFFFNSQWFFQYIPDYKSSYTQMGPLNVLFTFTAQTGYFQDRLLPGVTWVYDFTSNSGAALPEIQYRFTESFSATFGLALFWGRYQGRTYPINPLSLDNQVGRGAYTTWAENGLSVVRQRDEIFLSLRYTF